ncbi:hypothetical protein RUESEDTHA_02455 [Ruegeria sp. THAF57]|nr:hypothetical protein RUESEDTHA_02455 [Ruegeria sp. THAF57]
MTGGLIDTVLNLSVFAYVGFLIWLSQHPDP